MIGIQRLVKAAILAEVVRLEEVVTVVEEVMMTEEEGLKLLVLSDSELVLRAVFLLALSRAFLEVLSPALFVRASISLDVASIGLLASSMLLVVASVVAA